MRKARFNIFAAHYFWRLTATTDGCSNQTDAEAIVATTTNCRCHDLTCDSVRMAVIGLRSIHYSMAIRSFSSLSNRSSDSDVAVECEGDARSVPA